MQPYLRPPWTGFHQVLLVDVFHYAPQIHGIQNPEMQEKLFVMSSLLYSTALELTQDFVSVSIYKMKWNCISGIQQRHIYTNCISSVYNFTGSAKRRYAYSGIQLSSSLGYIEPVIFLPE